MIEWPEGHKNGSQSNALCGYATVPVFLCATPPCHLSTCAETLRCLCLCLCVCGLCVCCAVDDIVAHPYETSSDSFYFVEDKLIMHNKATYRYTIALELIKCTSHLTHRYMIVQRSIVCRSLHV